eukprot:scpid59712/ scgid12273/ 
MTMAQRASGYYVVTCQESASSSIRLHVSTLGLAEVDLRLARAVRSSASASAVLATSAILSAELSPHYATAPLHCLLSLRAFLWSSARLGGNGCLHLTSDLARSFAASVWSEPFTLIDGLVPGSSLRKCRLRHYRLLCEAAR